MGRNFGGRGGKNRGRRSCSCCFERQQTKRRHLLLHCQETQHVPQHTHTVARDGSLTSDSFSALIQSATRPCSSRVPCNRPDRLAGAACVCGAADACWPRSVWLGKPQYRRIGPSSWDDGPQIRDSSWPCLRRTPSPRMGKGMVAPGGSSRNTAKLVDTFETRDIYLDFTKKKIKRGREDLCGMTSKKAESRLGSGHLI